MPNNLRTLQEELNSGGLGPFTVEADIPVPVLPTRVDYNADNQIAADQLNELSRPSPVPTSEYLQYFIENEHRLEIGTDQYTRLSGAVGPATSLYSRLVEVTQILDSHEEGAAVDTVTNLWPRFWIQERSNRSDPANTNGQQKPVDKDEMHRCLAVLRILEADTAVDFGDPGNQQLLTGCRDALVMTQAQIAEILGRGNNRIARASEIKWRFIQATDVAAARALNGP